MITSETDDGVGYIRKYGGFSVMNETQIRRRFAFLWIISEIVFYCILRFPITIHVLT